MKVRTLKPVSPHSRSCPIPPVATFTSPGGRVFTLSMGERFTEHGRTYENWPILLYGKLVGSLGRNENYGKTAGGLRRWQASTSALVWAGPLPPLGLGFDVGPFDTAEECLAAWGRSADQILDWREGKAVPNLYAHSGVSQIGVSDTPPARRAPKKRRAVRT